MKAIYRLSDNSWVGVLDSLVNLTHIDPSVYKIEDLKSDDFEKVLNASVRPNRDRILYESDAKWVELASKGDDLGNINAYKQSLRDFPATIDFDAIEYIDEIVYPTLGD